MAPGLSDEQADAGWSTSSVARVPADTVRYHRGMAMTLRLSDEQADALRRRAEVEHTSMQQVALTAIDTYLGTPATPGRRTAVPVDELFTAFGDLPPMDRGRFRADQGEHIDNAAHFDAYLRAAQSEQST
jgi:hypothetical protein